MNNCGGVEGHTNECIRERNNPRMLIKFGQGPLAGIKPGPQFKMVVGDT